MKQTDDEKLAEITSRLEQLKAERAKFESDWKTAEKYVMPYAYDWGSLDAVPKRPDRFSSDPCNCLKTLVSGLTGYTISPNIEWFKLSLENGDLLNLCGVKNWLEECETRMFAEFVRSNLYEQAVPLVNYGAGYGHGVMFVGENIGRGTLWFSTLRENEIYLDVNEYNQVDTVFRTYEMTLINAVSFFGMDNMDKTVQQDMKDTSRRFDKIEILSAVYPRKAFDPKMKDSKNMPYAAVYIDVTHNHIISESGYNEFPYAVFEWEQYPGFAYGTSPAQNAIPTIRYLELVTETSSKICQLAAEPPVLAPDGMDVSMLPRAINYRIKSDDKIEAIQTGQNYPITIQKEQDLQQKVKNWFFVDFFLMLEQKQGQMTATEVMELQGEKAATLSNIIVSLDETLKQIVSRSFNLLYNAGRLPPVPSSLRGESARMKVVYNGPLAMAQKKYHTSGGIAQALSLAQPIIQTFPTAADFIDSDELIKHAMEGQGMPQKVIREDDDVDKLREARAQAQAQAAQQAQRQQMAQQLMSNAGKMNAPVEKNSMLDQLNQQLAGGLNNGQ